MKIFCLSMTLLVFVGACNPRPKRPGSTKNTKSVVEQPITPGSDEQLPEGPQAFVDSNEPLDTYISIGPYLQKEFDSTESSGKVVKVFLQVRQENSVIHNYASLKELIGSLHASITPALDNALKKGDSTVEFEADVVSLKTSVTMINKAASGIEISLPAIK